MRNLLQSFSLQSPLQLAFHRRVFDPCTAPDNSMSLFYSALETGGSLIEMDVAMLRSSTPGVGRDFIFSHDLTTHRTTTIQTENWLDCNLADVEGSSIVARQFRSGDFTDEYRVTRDKVRQSIEQSAQHSVADNIPGHICLGWEPRTPAIIRRCDLLLRRLTRSSSALRCRAQQSGGSSQISDC